MAQPPRIAESLGRWLKVLEASMQAMSTAQTRVTEAEQALAQNGAQLAALRALSQRLTIGQETVDAALEILWAEETRLSDALDELETRLSSRPADGGEHAEAERAEAKVAAHEAHAALGSVQQSLVDVTASVQPAAARPTPMTETEEELREALGLVVNTHLNALLWTQQETEELERSIHALLHPHRQVLR